MAADDPEETGRSRLQLIWDVLVFQLKLAVDGIRDVLLVPVSMVAALIGLIAGGRQPDKYYRRVLRFGRRTEIWINLFGYRKHAETSDNLIEPLQQKVFEELGRSPTLKKAGDGLNRTLDQVNAGLVAQKDKRDDKSE